MIWMISSVVGLFGASREKEHHPAFKGSGLDLPFSSQFSGGLYGLVPKYFRNASLKPL
jgi:hypothetical protein